MMQRLFTTEALAELLHVSTRTIMRERMAGRIGFKKIRGESDLLKTMSTPTWRSKRDLQAEAAGGKWKTTETYAFSPLGISSFQAAPLIARIAGHERSQGCIAKNIRSVLHAVKKPGMPMAKASGSLRLWRDTTLHFDTHTKEDSHEKECKRFHPR